MKVFSYDLGVPSIVHFRLFVPQELCLNEGRYNCNKGPPSTLKVFTSSYWGKEVLEKIILVLEKSLNSPWFFSQKFCMNHGYYDLICQAPEIATLKIRRLFTRCYDVNQTFQPSSVFWPIGACIRIWCTASGVPKVFLQALHLSPLRFFHPYPKQGVCSRVKQ